MSYKTEYDIDPALSVAPNDLKAYASAVEFRHGVLTASAKAHRLARNAYAGATVLAAGIVATAHIGEGVNFDNAGGLALGIGISALAGATAWQHVRAELKDDAATEYAQEVAGVFTSDGLAPPTVD